MSDAFNSYGQGRDQSPKSTDLKDQAKTIGRNLKNKAADLSDTVTRAAKDQAAGLGTAAKDVASGAAEKVQTIIGDQKTAGANYIGSVARAVDRAAGEFEQDVPYAARYIRQAAGHIDDVAVAVRDRDVRELIGEVETFARRQPALFFGGVLMLGFAALRFFKSSTPRSTSPSSEPQRAAQAS